MCRLQLIDSGPPESCALSLWAELLLSGGRGAQSWEKNDNVGGQAAQNTTGNNGEGAGKKCEPFCESDGLLYFYEYHQKESLSLQCQCSARITSQVYVSLQTCQGVARRENYSLTQADY